VPLSAQILSANELTADCGTHGTRICRQGDALMEAMTVAHYGRILAVCMGPDGAWDVIPVQQRPRSDHGDRLDLEEKIRIGQSAQNAQRAAGRMVAEPGLDQGARLWHVVRVDDVDRNLGNVG
jgi:hypothetical protein